MKSEASIITASPHGVRMQDLPTPMTSNGFTNGTPSTSTPSTENQAPKIEPHTPKYGGIPFQPHSLGSYPGLKDEPGFGSFAAAAAAMLGGQAAGAGQAAVQGEVGGLGGLGADLSRPLGADLSRLHPTAIHQWLQQAQAQQAQQAHQAQEHSPPSNDEPMDRESSPHSSQGGPGSDYAAL